MKVIPLASAAVSLCAAPEKVIEPFTRPVEPVAMLIVRAVAVSILSDDPEAMSKQLMPPLRVIVPVGLTSRVIFVPPPTEIAANVKPGGTFMMVLVAPLLKAMISPFAGALRPPTPSHPLQFPVVAQLELISPVQVQEATGVGLNTRVDSTELRAQ